MSAAMRCVDMEVVINSGGIIKDVREYAAEQGIAEEEALKRGMKVKLKGLLKKSAEVHAKA